MLQIFKAFGDEAEALRLIEAKLQIGVFWRKLQSDEMTWSNGLYNLLGLNPGEIPPTFKAIHSFMHPEDRMSFQYVNAAQARGRPFDVQFRIIRRNGTLRDIRSRGEVIVNPMGEPECTIGVWQDVTDIREMNDERALIASRFEAYVEASGDLGYVVKADGNVTEILGDAARHGSSADNWLGLEWRDLVHPEDLPETLEAWSQAAINCKPLNREHRVRSQRDGYRWRRICAVPVFNPDDSVREYVGISRNIDREKAVPAEPRSGHEITGAQIRAGRAIANWSVRDLAERSGVSPNTIRRLEETNAEVANAEEARLIRDTLTNAGVEFIFPATGHPGVRPA